MPPTRRWDTPEEPNTIVTIEPRCQWCARAAAVLTIRSPADREDRLPRTGPRLVKPAIWPGTTPSTLLCAAPATVASVVRTSVTARTPGWRARTVARVGVRPASVL